MNTLSSRTASRSSLPRSPVACASLAIVLLAALLLKACADDTPTNPADAGARVTAAMTSGDSTKVVIEPHWLTLDTIGVTDTLTATVLDADGDTIDDATVAWESADTTIATVDTLGVVTSVDFGKTRVMATYDSATGEATVEVAEPLTDREILEIFYEATGGEDWEENEDWLSDEDIDDWYGVSANRGKVTGLLLYENNLAGTIPPELGGLDELFSLDLRYNELSGPIPPELSKFNELRDLFLDGNAGISGSLPPELGYTGGLEYLYVDDTDLTGPVPLTFANLDLTRFYFDKDGVCIPAALKEWVDSIPQKEDYYQLCTDQIVIDPPSLFLELHTPGDTARLTAAVINAEGDTVPDAEITWASADTAIAAVDSTGLVTTVDYGTVDITATSDSLADTAQVKIVFKLSNRQVLDSIYRLTGGENWTDTTNWLSDEPLSEWFGVETSNSGEVVGLALGDNNLTGSIPRVLAELDSLVTLDLGGNALAGGIPQDLRELAQLRDLLLDGNALEGLLPANLGDMSALRYLHIGDNKLGGVVPRPFRNLELDTLYAAGSGVCVPPSLGDWFEEIERTDSAARCVPSINIEVVDLPSLSFYAIGETGDLTATYVSAEGDTTLEAVTWSSGDTAVVTVDAWGRVTAVGSGETEVTATYDSTSGTMAAAVALPENDRDVLEILYDRTRGDGWTDDGNWLGDEPLSEWSGVETDDSGRVTGLSLPGNNLRGSIHSSIGLLDRLVALDLSKNWVSGSIPAEVGNLSLLQRLTLSVNGFVGELPSALGTLDSLRTLTVAATRLSGLVPTSFADLDLETFLVNGTQLCLPPSLSGWLDFVEETDDPPECTSRVTVEPSSLTFGAGGDTVRLSATVTDSEGNIVDDARVTWASADTRVARVDATGLVTARSSGVTGVTATYDSVASGSADVAVRLPGSDRAALEALYRAMGGDGWKDNTNWMSDEPLGAWYGVDTTANGRVGRLSLGKNNLTGRVPAAIGLLDSLSLADLYRNALTGPIPRAVGRLRNLEKLFLDRNENLSGPLPPEMGEMAGLWHLALSETGLSGPVPETFADLGLVKFFTYDSGLCIPRSLTDWFEAIPEAAEPIP